jgi:hypothetical protein
LGAAGLAEIVKGVGSHTVSIPSSTALETYPVSKKIPVVDFLSQHKLAAANPELQLTPV